MLTTPERWTRPVSPDPAGALGASGPGTRPTKALADQASEDSGLNSVDDFSPSKSDCSTLSILIFFYLHNDFPPKSAFSTHLEQTRQKKTALEEKE